MEESKKAFIFVIATLASAGIIGFLALFFVLVTEEVIENEIKVFDQVIMNLFRLIQTSFLDAAMILVTELGSLWFVALSSLLTILFLWIKYKDKLTVFFLIWAVAGGGLLNILLKNLLERNRPSGKAGANFGGSVFRVATP